MVSVILPTYNERDSIRDAIDSILNTLRSPLEIIVIDDNSPDKTWKIVQDLSYVNNNIKLLRRLKQKGLTSAIRDGISIAQGEIIILMDVDFSLPDDILMRMVGSLDNFDIAVCSRYVGDGRDFRNSFRVFTSRIFNLFAAWFLNSNIRDLNSGFLAFKKNVVDLSSLRGQYGEYCIGLLYQAQKGGLRITELPYSYTSREKGQSKTTSNIFRFIQYGLLYVFSVLRLKCASS